MFESALKSCEDKGGTGSDLSSSAGDSIPDACAETKERLAVCLAGVARCTLRAGDLRKGLRLAREAG